MEGFLFAAAALLIAVLCFAGLAGCGPRDELFSLEGTEQHP